MHCDILSATPPSIIFGLFEHVIFLDEHYSEECHKQWLALGLISELVSQAQIQRLYPYF